MHVDFLLLFLFSFPYLIVSFFIMFITTVLINKIPDVSFIILVFYFFHQRKQFKAKTNNKEKARYSLPSQLIQKIHEIL